MWSKYNSFKLNLQILTHVSKQVRAVLQDEPIVETRPASMSVGR